MISYLLELTDYFFVFDGTYRMWLKVGYYTPHNRWKQTTIEEYPLLVLQNWKIIMFSEDIKENLYEVGLLHKTKETA